MGAVDGSEWLFGTVPDPVAAADFEPYSGDPGYQPAATFRFTPFLEPRISGPVHIDEGDLLALALVGNSIGRGTVRATTGGTNRITNKISLSN